MSKDYDVGYGKPPKAHQFKPGNQAARKNKGKRKARGMTVQEALEKALKTKRKIRKGDKELSMTVAEIFGERIIQMVMTGNSRDLTKVMEIIQKHASGTLAQETEELTITYERAASSNVELPSADLWEKGT